MGVFFNRSGFLLRVRRRSQYYWFGFWVNHRLVYILTGLTRLWSPTIYFVQSTAELLNNIGDLPVENLHFVLRHMVLLHEVQEVDARRLGVELWILHHSTINNVAMEVVIILDSGSVWKHNVLIVWQKGLWLPASDDHGLVRRRELLQQEFKVVLVLLEIDQVHLDETCLLTLLRNVDLTPALGNLEHHRAHLGVEVVFDLDCSPE